MIEILDTRFFNAHYGSGDTSTWGKTREKLSRLRRERRGRIPSIVVAEVAHILCVEAGRREALAQVRAMEQYGLEVVALDSGIASAAGILKCMHRDLPIADCIIAATALQAGGCVVTDDPHFRRIEGLRVTWI